MGSADYVDYGVVLLFHESDRHPPSTVALESDIALINLLISYGEVYKINLLAGDRIIIQSTETALTLVTNDILCSLDRWDSVFLVLLDLSAAFDNVDNKLLLAKLKNRVGLGWQVLHWATSYLSRRLYYVSVPGSSSEPRPLTCGVPQGSVQGSIFHHLHSTPW